MIEIENLTVTLGGRTIVSGLDLRVEKNETVAVSGESGSGKSTLLRAIIGRFRLETGSIVIDGRPLETANLSDIRSRLYYLPQDILPLGEETALEFLKMPFGLGVNRGLRFDETVAGAHMDELGLKSHLMESRLQDLSGGERKRLGLVQALLMKRPVLLLDELTSSVDERNSDRLADTVMNLKETTVLAVTHDTRFMARATRHLVFRNGRLEVQRG